MTRATSPWAGPRPRSGGEMTRPSSFSSRHAQLDGRVRPGHGGLGIACPHSLSATDARYPAAMTPVIIAAAARMPRRNPRAVRRGAGEGGYNKAPHNFVAQPVKAKAGAQLGNRNAARMPSADADRRAEINALLRTVSATTAAAERSLRERALLRSLLGGLS